MEFSPTDHLPTQDKQQEILDGLKSYIGDGGRPEEALMFDGLVYEQDPLSGDYYVVLYTGELQELVTDTDVPFIRLLATEKSLCIRNGSDEIERSQAENFARFIDPDEDKDDGEWEKLDWTPRVVEIPIALLGTHAIMSLPCDKDGRPIELPDWD